jgi:hypothetical protein
MYTYLFPMFFVPAFGIRTAGPFVRQRATIGFLADARSGRIVAQSLSVGPHVSDLYHAALQSRRCCLNAEAAVGAACVRVCPPAWTERDTSGGKYVEPQTDVVLQSLIFRKKRRSLCIVDESKLSAVIVHCLYDWPFNIHLHITDPHIIEVSVLILLVDTAVIRINQEVDSNPEWFRKS